MFRCNLHLLLLFLLVKGAIFGIGPTPPTSCCPVVQFQCHREGPSCWEVCDIFLEENCHSSSTCIKEYAWKGKFCNGRKIYEGEKDEWGTGLNLLFDKSWKVINRTQCEEHPYDWIQFDGLDWSVDFGSNLQSLNPMCPEDEENWHYWRIWEHAPYLDACFDCTCKTITPVTPAPGGDDNFEWPPAATWCLIGLLLACLSYAGYRWTQRPKPIDPRLTARLEARNRVLSIFDPRQATNQYQRTKISSLPPGHQDRPPPGPGQLPPPPWPLRRPGRRWILARPGWVEWTHQLQEIHLQRNISQMFLRPLMQRH